MKKSFRSFWPKPWFLSRGYWRMKRFRILSFKTAPHVRWVVKEKTSKKADHFTGFCQGGTEEKKFRIFSFKTVRTVKGVLERKKFPNFLAKQPIFLQWVPRRKVSEKADHFTGFCPVSIEGRIFQNLSFKTGKTLQWVVERRNFRKPSVLALRRGYQMRERKFSLKT